MAILHKTVSWVLLALLVYLRVSLISGSCEFSFHNQNNLYRFSLASATRNYPHGVLSEDGFYKVAVNDTILWFQLCDQMIFNHDPPRCFECRDCGGPLRCGFNCSALMAANFAGYHVCTTIGKASNLEITLIDEKNPQKGVLVKMSTSTSKTKCSLSVSVFCDLHGAQGPDSLDKLGTCDYNISTAKIFLKDHYACHANTTHDHGVILATVLRHPAGCARVISIKGGGWGWFGILITIFLCLLGGYLLAGIVYRFFFLGVRGVEVVPNLEFWLSLPQQSQSLLGALVRRFRGRPQASQSSYTWVQHSFH